MISLVIAGSAAVLVCLYGYRLGVLRNEVELHDKLRRNDARLAAERWEVLQERHDLVIELIAQIAETKTEVKGAPKQKRKKAT